MWTYLKAFASSPLIFPLDQGPIVRCRTSPQYDRDGFPPVNAKWQAGRVNSQPPIAPPARRFLAGAGRAAVPALPPGAPVRRHAAAAAPAHAGHFGGRLAAAAAAVGARGRGAGRRGDDPVLLRHRGACALPRRAADPDLRGADRPQAHSPGHPPVRRAAPGCARRPAEIPAGHRRHPARAQFGGRGSRAACAGLHGGNLGLAHADRARGGNLVCGAPGRRDAAHARRLLVLVRQPAGLPVHPGALVPALRPLVLVFVAGVAAGAAPHSHPPRPHRRARASSGAAPTRSCRSWLRTAPCWLD